MRILHVISAYPPSAGGAQVHAEALAQAQAARGDEVHVGTVWRTTRKDWLRGTTVTAPRPRPSHRDPQGVTVHSCGLPAQRRPSAALPALTYYGAMRTLAPRLTAMWRQEAARLVQAAAPEVAHLSRLGREGFYQAVVDELEARGIPWVLTPNHHPHWTRHRDWWWIDLYQRAHAVLAFSDAERDSLRQCGVDAHRMVTTVVGPIGVDPDREEASLPPDPRVVFVGQVRGYKGLDLVFDAVEDLRRDGLPATLDVVGPWVDRMPLLRQRLRSATWVTVHDHVSETRKLQLLRSARVLCVPSTEESLGGVHLEAWACGRPTVGADIPPVRSLFDSGGGGLTVPPTRDGVAQALRRLSTDEELASRLATNGRHAVATTFNWEVAADRAATAYALAATTTHDGPG